MWPPGRFPGAGGSTGRTAPGSGPRRRAPGIRCLNRRRVPSRREAGGCPPPRVRGEPPGNLFSDESAGSSRSGPDPDGESEPTGSRRGADGRRREIQVHGSQTMCSSQPCDPGARGGVRISPRPRWSHSLPRGCGRWRASRSPEKLTGSRSGRLLGASSRRRAMHTRPLATPDRRRSGLRRAAGLCTLAPLHGRRTTEPLNNSVARDIAARDTMARH